METDNNAPHAIPETQEPDYVLPKAWMMYHIATVCISGVLRQGVGGNGEKEGEYRESRTH